MEGSWSLGSLTCHILRRGVSPRVSTHHDPGQSLGPTWSFFFFYFRFSLVMFLMLVRAFWLFMEPHKSTINASVFKLACVSYFGWGWEVGENFLLT